MQSEGAYILNAHISIIQKCYFRFSLTNNERHSKFTLALAHASLASFCAAQEPIMLNCPRPANHKVENALSGLLMSFSLKRSGRLIQRFLKSVFRAFVKNPAAVTVAHALWKCTSLSLSFKNRSQQRHRRDNRLVDLLSEKPGRPPDPLMRTEQ